VWVCFGVEWVDNGGHFGVKMAKMAKMKKKIQEILARK
jgi:hypothetical protein